MRLALSLCREQVKRIQTTGACCELKPLTLTVQNDMCKLWKHVLVLFTRRCLPAMQPWQ